MLPPRGLADPAPASALPPEGERAHVGFVPGRDGGPFWTRVFDAETGRPVAEATLIRHDENAASGAFDLATVLGAATTDEHGLAVIRRDEKPGDAHWVVRAPGYAPAIEYGSRPPSSFVLRRGEPVTILVLDPFGCPTAGARVDWLDGCSHSPALAHGVTDEQGLARLTDVDATRGQVWVESPAGGLLTPLDLEDLVALGERQPTVLLQTGPVARGIVVDPLGQPVRGVVLRSQRFGRGPVTMSRDDGHFRLAAMPGSDTLWVRPFELWPDHVPLLDDVDLSVPLRLVVTPNGLVPRTWAGARARVVVQFPASAPKESLFLRVRSDDGSLQTVECAPVADRPNQLAGAIDVAPGHAHRVLVPEEFEFDASTEPFTLAPGAEATIPVRFVPKAALHIVGTVPAQAELTLVPGNAMRRIDGADEPIRVSADVPLWLRVDDGLGPARLFEVAPVDEHGVRTVDVAFPAPHLIRWVPGVAVRDVSLRLGRRRLRADETTEGLRTFATGFCELVAMLEGEERPRRLAIRLPADEPIVLQVDPRAGTPIDDSDVGSYRIVVPKEATGRLSTATRTHGGGAWGAADGRVSATIGSEITVMLEGYVTHHFVVTKPETREIAWGPCSIDVSVVDSEGAPVEARLVLDDATYPVHEGRLTLAGLAAGPHRFLVVAADADDGGREIDVVLKAGERRTLRVTL